MKQRIVTGGLAAIVFLTLLIIGDIWFAGLILIMSFISFYEYYKIYPIKLLGAPISLGYIGLLLFIIPWYHIGFEFTLSFEALLWLIMLCLFTITVVSKNKMKIENVATLFIGIVYIGVGFHYMIVTRLMDDGLFWTLLVFACIWFTDTGAYFSGMVFGKRLLWPSISPKKTVEGAIGGILLSVVAAVVFSLFSAGLLSILTAIWLGFAIAVVGQLGDFIQSAYKRAWGVKDSGNILPGHGGLLDRCDSWLIVFPFVHLVSILP